MKTMRFISTLAMLALATVVTVGSMYVTASAAAQQEADAIAIPGNLTPDENPVVQEDPLAKLIPADVPPPLTPEEIFSSRSETVILDADGGFSGHLSALRAPDGVATPASSYTVKILQHGAIVATQQTGADGGFAFTGMQPGVTGFVAYSPNGLAIIGMNLSTGTIEGDEPIPIEATVIEGVD
ncbi:MAG TPA: hypothetical protein PK992_18965, partial [Planctomycetaceae bacterium]|nr:hypothetical protein [Planctomycetaceae bacterium]